MRKGSTPKTKRPGWARFKKNGWIWDLTMRWINTYGLHQVKEWASLKSAEANYCDDERDMVDNLNHMIFNGTRGLKFASKSEVASHIWDWTDRWAGDDPAEHIKKAEDQMQIWATAEAKGTYRPRRVR